jgi:hypothetical protein
MMEFIYKFGISHSMVKLTLGLFKGDCLNQIFGLKFDGLPNQRFYPISWFKIEPNQTSSKMLRLTFVPNQSLNQIVCGIISGFIYWVKYSHIEKKNELKVRIFKLLADEPLSK